MWIEEYIVGYTEIYTVTYNSFHDEMFYFYTLVFVCLFAIVFVVVCFILTERLQG